MQKHRRTLKQRIQACQADRILMAGVAVHMEFEAVTSEEGCIQRAGLKADAYGKEIRCIGQTPLSPVFTSVFGLSTEHTSLRQ